MNKNSGLVLDINGNSTTEGARCIQNQYNGNWSQLWSVVRTSDGYYNIVNRNSNMVLQIEDKATSAGAFCIQSTNDGNISQKWIIQVVE